MTLKQKIKPKTYDFYLMIITSTVLSGIGLVCLYGIAYYTYTNQIMPQWTETPLYKEYIDNMNQYMYPFVVLLLVTLGLCIPKRIVQRHSLFIAGMSLLGLTIITAILTTIKISLEVLLGISLLIQTAVMVLTILKRGSLTYERVGYSIQTGSSMLHLGFVIFVLDFTSMRTSAYHISVFWVATILITMGTTLSFYPAQMEGIFKTVRMWVSSKIRL
jgi:hypothetical protein